MDECAADGHDAAELGAGHGPRGRRHIAQVEIVVSRRKTAVVAPSVRRRADLVACVMAAALSLICQPLPWKSWIIIAACGGIAAGWLTHYHAQMQGKFTADKNGGAS